MICNKRSLVKFKRNVLNKVGLTMKENIWRIMKIYVSTFPSAWRLRGSRIKFLSMLANEELLKLKLERWSNWSTSWDIQLWICMKHSLAQLPLSSVSLTQCALDSMVNHERNPFYFCHQKYHHFHYQGKIIPFYTKWI